MHPDLEIRRVTLANLRAEQAADDFRPILRGTAIVFNSLSLDLGGFVEIIRPRAITRTIDEKIDLRALVDHDTGKVIGRLSAGTLKVKADEAGLHIEIVPPNTSVGRDIVESVRRGDIDEMSFAFRVLDQAWNFEADPVLREVLDMRVSEVSVVAWGAFPATEVDVARRSFEAAKQRHGRLSLPALRAQLDAKLAGWK